MKKPPEARKVTTLQRTLLASFGRGGGDVSAAAVVAQPALAEEEHAVAAAQAAHDVDDAAGLARALGDLDGVEPALKEAAEEAHGRHMVARDEIHVVADVRGHVREVEVAGVVRQYQHRLGVAHGPADPDAVSAPGDQTENGAEERIDAAVIGVRLPARFVLGAHSVQTSSGLLA